MKLSELEQLWDMQPGQLETIMRNMIGADATLEEIEAAVAEMMYGVEQTLARPYTLQECLSCLDKDDLIEISKALKLKDCSKMRKEELRLLLHNTFISPEYMQRIYSGLSNGEVGMLKELCAINIPAVSTDIMYCTTELLRHGLCYLEESGKHLVMPEELKTTFLTAQANPELQRQQKENSVFYDLCSAAVYFYGVYPIAELCEQLEKQLNRPVSENELLQWHSNSAIYREDFFFKNGAIISSSLMHTPEDVIALQQLQKIKKRTFWPDAQALKSLAMEQWLIEEDVYDPFWDCAPFLMDNEFGDILSVSRFVEASIRTGATFDALMGFLSEQIFAFESAEQIDTFIQIMTNIWEHTPMWENCGYSPKQLRIDDQQKNKPQNDSAQKASAKSNVISLAEHKAKKNKS